MKETTTVGREKTRQRMTGEERRRQIVETTLRLVAARGVQGTTLHRIADEIGVTHPALYVHFPSRRDILLAAIDLVFQRMLEVYQAFSQENALERLRAICEYHTDLVTSASDGFVHPLFEFIAASPEEGLRDELAAREQMLYRSLTDIVEEGQRQGTIRPDIDPPQAVFLLTSRHWAEYVMVLTRVTDTRYRARSLKMLDLVLQSISAPNSAASAD